MWMISLFSYLSFYSDTEKTQVFCYKKPIMRDKRSNKGVKSLTQTQIFASLYLCNLMV